MHTPSGVIYMLKYPIQKDINLHTLSIPLKQTPDKEKTRNPFFTAASSCTHLQTPLQTGHFLSPRLTAASHHMPQAL
jgi:hypothetical protein